MGESGILEGFNNVTQTYEPICSDYLTADTAKAICGILGYSRDSAIVSHDGTSTTSLPVSDLNCQPTDTSIDQCYFGTDSGCEAMEQVVQISCSRPTVPFTFTIGTNGLVVATNGNTNVDGTVCNDGMSLATAVEICRLSGVASPSGVQWWTLANYMSYPVNLESVACPSMTTDFASQCNYSLASDCTNLEAVAINCGSTPLDVDFTLGENGVLWAAAKGSVIPGYVGSSTFDADSAVATCRMMGYTNLGSVSFSTTSVTTNFQFFSALSCPSSATGISGCSYTLGREQASSSAVNVVTLNCGSARASYSVQQLSSKLLQVQAPGTSTWGTVCSDSLTATTVRGLCGVLGQSTTNVGWWTLAGTGSILIDELSCPLNAAALSDCTFDTTTDCTHNEDVAIACDTTQPLFTFSLDGATGALMVKTPSGGATNQYVCGDSIDTATATAFCKMLGLPTDSVTTTTAPVTDINTVGIRAASCPATAGNIFDCSSFSQTGSCLNYLQINCESTTAAPTTTAAPGSTTFPTGTSSGLQLKIVNGILQGYDIAAGTWSPVCSDFFDAVTAAGVCNLLGLPSGAPSFYSNDFGTGNLAVSDLMCPATATSTSQCSYGTNPACADGETVVHLACPAPTGAFTFAFGDHRLLLATNTETNVVGTVCNDGFSQATAVELCKLSGVAAPTNVQWWTQSNYESYPVALTSVSCPAGATSKFSDCSFSQNHDCTNLEAVAINCGANPLVVDFSLGSGGVLWAAASGSVMPGYVEATGFDLPTAQAVCSWMGYTDVPAVSFGTTSVSSSFAFFSGLTCGASASSLAQCTTATLGRELGAAQTMTVVTLNCGTARAQYTLSQSSTLLVQVTSPGNTVGTMCGDGINPTTARGLCAILGKPSSNVGWWSQGGATGSILVDELKCNSTASTLGECQFDTTSDCTHDEDLALACDTTQPVFTFSLSTATTPGLVQVMTPGGATAAPVCGDAIDYATAAGLCNILGFPGATPTFGATPGSSLPANTVRGLICPAGAASIFDCKFSLAGTCTSSLTLSCASPSTTPSGTGPASALQLRLGSNNVLEGRLSSAASFEPVCSDLIDAGTAAGICGILGLSRSSPTFSAATAGSGTLAVSDIVCPSTAGSTADCTWNGDAACSTENAVTLQCGQVQADFTFATDAVTRMLLATRVSDGVVGTVCNDGITPVTAQGLCKIVTGTDSPNAIAWTVSVYSGMPVVLDEVVCPAAPADFKTDCTYALSSDCTNLEAIALGCNGNELSVSFSLGTNKELMTTATGSVKATYVAGTTLSADTATAVCKMLGFTGTIAPTVGTVKATTRYTLLTSLSCPATATALAQCQITAGQEANTDAQIDVVTLDCGAGAVQNPYAVQLVGTRVQAKAPGSNVWGTICNDGMTLATAKGLCAILNKPSANVAFWNLRGSGSIVVDSLVCPATAATMKDCQFETTSDCSHDEDLALACDTTQPVFAFKVGASGSVANAALAQVAVNSPDWGTVCGDNIDQNTANALCAWSGLPSGGATFSSVPTSPLNDLILSAINCPASATSIFQCTFSQVGGCSSVLALNCATGAPGSSTTITGITQTTGTGITQTTGTGITQTTGTGITQTTGTVTQTTMTAAPTTTTTAAPTTTTTAHRDFRIVINASIGISQVASNLAAALNINIADISYNRVSGSDNTEYFLYFYGKFADQAGNSLTAMNDVSLKNLGVISVTVNQNGTTQPPATAAPGTTAAPIQLTATLKAATTATDFTTKVLNYLQKNGFPNYASSDIAVTVSGTTATITLTGPYAAAASKKLESLTDADQQSLGVTSQFAPVTTNPEDKKNNIPIIAGAAGGAVVLIALLIFLKTRGNKNDDEPAHRAFDAYHQHFSEEKGSHYAANYELQNGDNLV